MSATVSNAIYETPANGQREWLQGRNLTLLIAVGVLVTMSIARIVADADRLTAGSTISAGLGAAIPIALAGFGGLYAERTGTVNIGLDGMMTLGTVMAGWAGWHWGPWAAIIAGIIGGMMGGMLMSLATTTFGVNHIIAGVAINIIGPGVSRYLANVWFTTPEAAAAGGSISSSPATDGKFPEISLPFLSGGAGTSDLLGELERTGWFILGDIGGILGGLTRDIGVEVILAVVLMVAAAYVMWSTPIGLRLRSAGEKPGAAESLGVSVIAMRHIGMLVSGGFAGLGGAILVFAGARQYQEGLVAGRGFLGLAALVFGNWLPGGVAAGAAVFGYPLGVELSLDAGSSVRALILAAAIGLAVFALRALIRQRFIEATVEVAFALLAFYTYLKVEEVNDKFTYMTPYIITLIVITIFANRQRPPAAEGIPYLKGQSL